MPNEKLLKISIALVLVLGLLILSSCASNKAREDSKNYLCNQAQVVAFTYEFSACVRRAWMPERIGSKRQAYCTEQSVMAACTFKGDL